jgi:IS5 family transposase
MLRRDREPKQVSFADQARAALSVPDDHPLLQMKRAVDWDGVESELAEYYASGEGRPSWPPAVLVRMLIVEQYADLSDRDVHEQVGYNLLYRAFVGLGMEDRVPDDTTLVRFRQRVGEAGLRKVFETLNRQWEAGGLMGSERRVLDGVHLWAKVARRSWTQLMRQGRALVVEAVAGVDAARARALEQEFVGAGSEPESRGPEALALERQRTAALLERVADLEDERVRERAQLLRAFLKENDRPVSFHDPDARWGYKSEDKPFCGYKSHEAMDPDSRLITSVDVVAGNANEAVRTDVLLEGEPTQRRPGSAVIADALYNNATTVAQVEGAGGRPCFSGLQAERVSDAFDYDPSTDQVVCAQGKRSIGKVRIGNGDLYYFSLTDCGVCPLREGCLTRGEREGTALPRRRVFLSDVRKQKRLEGKAGHAWRKAQLKLRGRIEAKFDEQMNRHGLRRARYWGLPKVTMQVLLNVITVNMKRAAKLLRARAAPAQPTVVALAS